MALLWDSAFIRTEIVSIHFGPRELTVTWGFRAFYFGLISNKIEGKNATQTCQTVNSLGQ